MKNLVREIALANGLTVYFTDATRRYFGDYHQVRVEISCEIPLGADFFADHKEYESARKLLGPKVRYHKLVEHQGVPTDDTAAAVQRVIQQFIDHSLGYFGSETFPRRLVQSELSRLRTKSKAFISPHSHG